MATKYDEMSDAELDAIIAGQKPIGEAAPGQGFEALAERNAAVKAKEAQLRPVEDNSQGMSGWQLALAGAGADLNEMGQGIKEKAQLAFGADDTTAANINAERGERKRINEALFSNPEAQAGRFGSQAAMFAAAPARLLAQMALQGSMDFMRPGTEKASGIGKELIGSTMRGGIGAGAMGLIGKGVQGLGKVVGAGLNRMTPEGEIALATKAAAERLGLPATSLGQLYQHSSLGTLERTAPGMGHSERVGGQADALRTALDRPLHTPEGAVPNVGGAYVEEIAQAAKNRLALGSEKYDLVDKAVVDNGLQPLSLMYTARVATNTKNPGYDKAADLLSDYGFDIRLMQGFPASHFANQPATFAQMHQTRIATNKALNRINQDIARGGPSDTTEARQAQKYLRDMKTALDNDAERWGTQNKGNEDALSLYKDATQYYKDVVAPTVLDNRIARKALSPYRGFETGRQGLAAATSEAGIPLVQRLEPTMSPSGMDMTQVLRNLPDVRKVVLSQDATVPQQSGALSQAAKAALGHPLTVAEAVATRLPGLRQLSESNLAARLYGAENAFEGVAPAGLRGSLRERFAPRQGVLPRVAYAGAQYPQDEADRKVRQLLGAR